MGTFIFIAAVSTLFCLFYFFILRPHEKEIERKRKAFQFIQDESLRICKEKGISEADIFIDSNIEELIEMPTTFFLGRKFRTVKEFCEEVGKGYNDQELEDFLLRGKYRDSDIENFSILIKNALLSEAPA